MDPEEKKKEETSEEKPESTVEATWAHDELQELEDWILEQGIVLRY